MTAPTRRVNRGRGHSYYLDGEPVIGVTTAINRGWPKPALTPWAARCVAEWAAENPPTEDRDAWIATAKAAPDRKRNALALRGTQIHELAERVSMEEEVDVPAEVAGHVEQYLRFMEELEPVFVAVERPVFSRKSRYAGTFDFVAELPAITGAGTTLVDIKTGSGVYGDVALQLAAYRYADVWLAEDGEERPMADLRIAATAVLWLANDAYELRPVTTTEAVWRHFRYVQQSAELAGTIEELVGHPVVTA